MGRNKTRTIAKGPVQVTVVQRVNKRGIKTHTHVPVPQTQTNKQKAGISKPSGKASQKTNVEGQMFEQYDPIQMLPLENDESRNKV